MSCYRHSHLMLLTSGLIELHTTLMDKPRDSRSREGENLNSTVSASFLVELLGHLKLECFESR